MLSSVAAIVDPKGGLRVVVTERWRFKYHLSKGERLFIVPDFKVQEPVPWDDIPGVIKKAHDHVDWWIRTRNHPRHLKDPTIAAYIERTYNKPVELASAQ